MANNTQLNVATTSGDVITDVDLSSFAGYPSTGKLPCSCIYVGPLTSAAPTPVSNANPLPVGVQGPVAVTGTFWQATQPVSAASLPLPAGAATSAKQAAPGAAGTPSADVLTVQGATSMTPVKVDGSAVTQPVSGTVGGYAATPSATFTRPADTATYAPGDLVANGTAAGSVVPMSWTAARVAGGSGMVRRARLKKSGTAVTAANFRLHLYGSDPSASTGITNGDNGAWLTKQAGYLGSFDLDMSGVNGRVFSDAAEVIGPPTVGSDVTFSLASGQTVYGLLEARAAYTPASAEVLTVELEILQN
jgi:hypothetical protein